MRELSHTPEFYGHEKVVVYNHLCMDHIIYMDRSTGTVRPAGIIWPLGSLDSLGHRVTLPRSSSIKAAEICLGEEPA